MPRPPNHRFGNSPRGERERQPRRQFSLPIPAVEPATLEAVQNFIREKQPCLVHRAAWDQARYKTERVRQQVKELEERLDELNTEKEQAIKDIRDTRNEQAQRVLLKMERKMRVEHERDLKGKDEKFERELLFSTERSQKAMQQETERTLDEKDKSSEEPPSKRPKLNAEGEDKGDEKDGVKEKSDSPEDGELAISKQLHKIGEDDNAKAAVPSLNETKDESLKLDGTLMSATKAEELKKANAQIEHLRETKSQMVWLLRQVITAENKRKVQAKSAKKS